MIFHVKEFGAKGNAKYRNPANGHYDQDSAYSIPADDDTAAFNLALLAIWILQ